MENPYKLVSNRQLNFLEKYLETIKEFVSKESFNNIQMQLNWIKAEKIKRNIK
jgi:hypothetical protein